jgi:hypothetical protein
VRVDTESGPGQSKDQRQIGEVLLARRIKSIHPAIREALGYDQEQSVQEVLQDWRRRTSRVCKPCWELKYCPYGPLVEQLPLLPARRGEIADAHEYYRRCLETGLIGEQTPVNEESASRLSAILEDDEFAWEVACREVDSEMRFEIASDEDDPVQAIFGQPLPPPHIYRIPFDMGRTSEGSRADVPHAVQNRIWAKVEEVRTKAREALETGLEDNRKPLDKARRKWFEETLENYDPENYPEEIPEIFAEASCNIFGHVCPVFFTAEVATETSEERRMGRYIPFSVKMRVVRRDNHTCQECGIHLRDDEVEFDHIIPLSKGGSTEEQNLRLTCFDCNRGKSADVRM